LKQRASKRSSPYFAFASRVFGIKIVWVPYFYSAIWTGKVPTQSIKVQNTKQKGIKNTGVMARARGKMTQTM
jgi:hypothetical protein